MPDFSKLYRRQAGIAKRPSALPVSQADDYPGIVKSFEYVEAPTNRPVEYESIVRVHLGLTDWPESGVDPEDQMEDDPQQEGAKRPIDLSRRRLRIDFYDNALYRLDEFIASCGIESAGRTYEDVLPELVGKEVLIEVQQYTNQRTGDIGNQVGRISGRG